jgi:di/tricarboxylate transporter
MQMYPVAKSVLQSQKAGAYAIMFALMFGASSSVMTPIGF